MLLPNRQSDCLTAGGFPEAHSAVEAARRNHSSAPTESAASNSVFMRQLKAELSGCYVPKPGHPAAPRQHPLAIGANCDAAHFSALSHRDCPQGVAIRTPDRGFAGTAGDNH